MTIRLIEELNELEKLALIPISYSRLDTMYNEKFGCDAKYFYQYILKEERVFGPHATLGNVIHQVLENSLDENITISSKELEPVFLKEFDVAKKEIDIEDEITDDLVENGIAMLMEFLDRHDGETIPIQHKELEFNVVIGSALVRGYIDRIDIYDNRVEVHDWKSGKAEVAQKNAHNNLQLGLYALVASKLFPDKEEVYASLYYLRSGRQKGHLFSADDLKAVESKLSFLVNQLIVKQNFQPTSNYSICYYCDFAKNGVCKTGAKRIRR